MDDVLKNVNRFYLNNFQDDSKQTLIDFLLGKASKNQGEEILLQNPILQELSSRLKKCVEDSKERRSFLIHVGTWNVNAKRPRGESLLPWLSFMIEEEPDLFVLGFQELVELSAKQVLIDKFSFLFFKIFIIFFFFFFFFF